MAGDRAHATWRRQAGQAAVRVDGARELRRSLKRAGLAVADLKAVNRQVADTVHAAAMRAAPRRTGRLAGTERPAGTQGAAIVRVGRASVPYGGPIHWGWPARNIPAHPWIADAAADTEVQWLATYMSHLERIVSTIEGAHGL